MSDHKADPDAEASESSREPAPSGAQAQNLDQNSPPQRVAHVCEGARCPCQRYENGELALVVMNRNRNPGNQDRDDGYQNMVRGPQQQQQRVYQNRGNNAAAANPNVLNPQYQNPVDLLRNYHRNGRIYEPEENIYERLDGEEEEDDPRAEGARNDNPGNAAVDQNDENHTYERIDNRPWYRAGGNAANRGNNCAPSNQQLPAANFWNLIDSANSNQYDHPRYGHLRARVFDNQSCFNRLGRLGRNCFSSESIASASNPRRYVYQLGHNRMCQSCTRFPFVHRDARYVCQHCNSFHERLRYYDPGNPTGPLGNSRHYIYQVPRSCRCAFCRGEYQYARFPINSNRLAESFRRECHCRSPGNCSCRGRMMSSSNSAIYIGRIDRVGLVQSINNPLYSSPTIYIGRIDRSCTSGLSNNSSNAATNLGDSSGGSATASIPSTSNGISAASGQNEPSTSTNQRAGVSASGPSTSGASSVCPISQSIERQHICDDSCIRSHPGNVTGVCQFLGRGERPDCHNGRVSFHWWFVNRWLPPWGSQSTERNAPAVVAGAPGAAEQPTPRADEPREPQESDTEESRD